jgi:pimeloyl-ACP methyl ester carboxylesterase
MNILNSAHHIAFIGGFTDRRPWNRVLFHQFKAYHSCFPHKTIAYFEWTQNRSIESWIKHNPHATLVGHSFGGDTAASIVAKGALVSTLITIDPVSRFPPALNKVADHCDYWVNYLATGQNRGWQSKRVNLVAKLGGHWMHKPEPFTDQHVICEQHDHMSICPFVLAAEKS